MLFEGGPAKDDSEEEKDGKPAKGKGSKSSAKAKGGDEDEDGSSGEYAIENAKNSRSTCKECNEKIEKGQVCIYLYFCWILLCLESYIAAEVSKTMNSQMHACEVQLVESGCLGSDC